MDLCFCIAANDPRPLDERAPELATYGVPCLEITWLGFPHWDPDRCARQREALAEHGVAMRSVHAPFGPELNILDDDPGLRLHSLEAHLHMLPATAALGAEILVMHPGRKYGAEPRPAGLIDLCVDVTTRVTARAADLGMRVALENVLPAHAFSEHEAIAEVVDRVAHPALGICLDTGHANVVDSVHRAIEVFAGRIIHVHIHDNNGKVDQHLCPGLGVIDWPRVVAELQQTGYDGPLTLECRPPPGMPNDDVRDFVRRALAGDEPHPEG